MNNQKGFTLIEMLVVIAVTGILAATVLTSIGPAREKAKDTRIMSALNQVRALAETVYDEGYGNLNDELLVDLNTDISKNNGSLLYDIYNGGNDYVAWSILNDGDYYCVDSQGGTYRGAAVPTVDNPCPSS